MYTTYEALICSKCNKHAAAISVKLKPMCGDCGDTIVKKIISIGDK